MTAGGHGAADRIVAAATARPGAAETTGSRGERSLRAGRRETGLRHGRGQSRPAC